jgi:hypothetical protein
MGTSMFRKDWSRLRVEMDPQLLVRYLHALQVLCNV